jgi:hypothetical protein
MICPFTNMNCTPDCAIYYHNAFGIEGCSITMSAHRMALFQTDIDNIGRDIGNIKDSIDCIVERGNSDG